jgi:hypothetical protein
MINQRDLELLSAYLDGELNPSDSTRLEARLKNDSGLVSVLDDLRATRTLLRKLPMRRAPRNFTLTRKMVGLNPPLPRSYPAFRFVTTVATLLFFFTFGINALAPQFGAGAPTIGFGGGGGADQTELFSVQAPAATEAPAMEAAPAANEPPIGNSGLAPQPTLTAPEEDTARDADTQAAKNLVEGSAEVQAQPSAGREAQFIPSIWLLIFAGVALVGTIFMAWMRRSSINHWK